MGDYKAMDDYVMNNDALILVDEDKQHLILSIDSSQSVNYVLLHTYVKPLDTLGRTNAFLLCTDYPFDLFNEPVSDTFQSVTVFCDFDIYIPFQEDGGNKIMMAYALEHADGRRELLKASTINYDWYEYYDKWQHFTMTKSFGKTQVQYVDGDKLMGYLFNGGKIGFLISNFNLQMVGLHE